jgi:hypothetical protein
MYVNNARTRRERRTSDRKNFCTVRVRMINCNQNFQWVITFSCLAFLHTFSLRDMNITCRSNNKECNASFVVSWCVAPASYVHYSRTSLPTSHTKTHRNSVLQWCAIKRLTLYICRWRRTHCIQNVEIFRDFCDEYSVKAKFSSLYFFRIGSYSPPHGTRRTICIRIC